MDVAIRLTPPLGVVSAASFIAACSFRRSTAACLARVDFGRTSTFVIARQSRVIQSLESTEFSSADTGSESLDCAESGGVEASAAGEGAACSSIDVKVDGCGWYCGRPNTKWTCSKTRTRGSSSTSMHRWWLLDAPLLIGDMLIISFLRGPVDTTKRAHCQRVES